MSPEDELGSRWTRFKRWLIVTALTLLSPLWTKFKDTFPPNRVVLILGPTVLLPAAAWISATLAANVPNANFTPEQILAFVLPSLLGGLILLYKWFDGWIKDQVEKPLLIESEVSYDPPLLPPGEMSDHPDDAIVADPQEPIPAAFSSTAPPPSIPGA